MQAHFLARLGQFTGSRVVFVHNAGVLEPIGFAGEVDPAGYRRNVLLNSAAPQVLGAAFLRAVAESGFTGECWLLLLSSGAARNAYPGWSSYCAAKAAVDQWVRCVGQERRERGSPVTVVAVAPGVVDTAMQDAIRATDTADFPEVERFHQLHASGRLRDPADAARAIWSLLDRDVESGSVLDLGDA